MRQATRTEARDSRRTESGAVVVEFAIVLPFLAILLVGALDVGLLTMDHQILQNAARDGARYASLPFNDISDPVDGTAALARIRQRVVDYLSLEGITVAPGDVTIEQGAPNCEVTYPDATTVGCSEVTVLYDKSLYFPGLNLVGVGNSVSLRGRAVFRNLFGN